MSPNYKRQKDDFRKTYRHNFIFEHFERKIFLQFNNQCFVCASSEKLCFCHYDISIPLQAGDIVTLCKSCHAKKKEKPPSECFSSELQKKFSDLSVAQPAILEFKWNWEPYNEWKRNGNYMALYKYFIEIGLDPDLVDGLFHDPAYEEHGFYQKK